jgi:hypothetical protein
MVAGWPGAAGWYIVPVKQPEAWTLTAQIIKITKTMLTVNKNDNIFFIFLFIIY